MSAGPVFGFHHLARQDTQLFNQLGLFLGARPGGDLHRQSDEAQAENPLQAFGRAAVEIGYEVAEPVDKMSELL